MALWLTFSLLVIAFASALLFVPIRIRISLQGRGEPSGSWALAGGAQSGPFALSAAAARGVDFRAQLHLLRKKLWQHVRAGSSHGEEPEQKVESAGAPLPKRLAHSYARIERWFDPLELLLFVTRERRRVELGLLELNLDYSFEDVALTGRVLGAVYLISGTFQGKIRIVQNVSWESVDRARAELDGSIKLWPGLMFVDSIVFILRHLKLKNQSKASKHGRQ